MTRPTITIGIMPGTKLLRIERRAPDLEPLREWQGAIRPGVSGVDRIHTPLRTALVGLVGGRLRRSLDPDNRAARSAPRYLGLNSGRALEGLLSRGTVWNFHPATQSLVSTGDLLAPACFR